MSLRVLDLRGTPPPFDAVLPRPDAPGADVHDAVAGILAEVRAEGDAALVRYTAAFDGVDVSERPAGPRTARSRRPRARVDPRCATRWRRRSGGSWPITRTRARLRATTSTAASRSAPDTPGGAGRAVRAGRAGPLPLDGPHVRRAGTGGGRGEHRAVRPPGRATARSTMPRCAPPRSPASTRCTASAGRRPSPPWPMAPTAIPAVDVIAGPGNAYVAEAKRQVSGVVGVASAFAGPSEIVVVAGPGATPGVRRHRPGGPGRARTRRSGLAGDLGRGAPRADRRPRSDRIVAASSRRADLESTLASSGIACLVDGPEAAMAVANTIAPEHLRAAGARGARRRRLLERRAERGSGLHRRVVAGQHGRLHRRAQPRPADEPHGPLRVGPAGRRLPQAHARRPA